MSVVMGRVQQDLCWGCGTWGAPGPTQVGCRGVTGGRENRGTGGVEAVRPQVNHEGQGWLRLNPWAVKSRGLL